MPRITVGVDAGGSKTAVVHAIDGETVRIDVRESANASVRGAEGAAIVIANAVEGSLDGALPHAIFVGAAGAEREEAARAIRGELKTRFPSAQIEVRNDAYIALRSAVPDGDGMVLIAGTGSIAYAERDGQGVRCGGYGYLVGDDGSGFAIGAAALKHAMKYYDGRVERDALVATLEEHFKAKSLTSMLDAVYAGTYPPSTIAGAARLVLETAREGDRASTKILQTAAAELTDLAKSAITRAGLLGSPAPIVFTGGLLHANSLLTFLLETRLSNEFPSMPIHKDNPHPCVGALALAERLLAERSVA